MNDIFPRKVGLRLFWLDVLRRGWVLTGVQTKGIILQIGLSRMHSFPSVEVSI